MNKQNKQLQPLIVMTLTHIFDPLQGGNSLEPFELAKRAKTNSEL